MLCFLLLVVYFNAESLAADVYVYKDKNGELTFTNNPTHQGFRRVIREKDPSDTPNKENTESTNSEDAPYISPESPRAIYSNQPTNQPITIFSDPVFSFFAFLILYLVGRPIYKCVFPGRCRYCNVRTLGETRICESCQIRIYNETAKTTEREWQDREARRRAEEAKRRDEARAQEERTGSSRSDAGFDPYEVLQVTRGASQKEIRAAYLNLLKQYHPDRLSHVGKEFEEMAKEKTQAINRAYETLASR
jgi:DnaJ-like protein/uncharacterized protein DUF4124